MPSLGQALRIARGAQFKCLRAGPIMPRYVLLTHDHPFPHYDLLLEHGGACRTWRLLGEPVAGEVLKAESLPDHRSHYLDYEGPVSGGRGVVARWDAGEYRVECEGSGFLRVATTGQRGLAGWLLQSRRGSSRWEALATVSAPPNITVEKYASYVTHPRFGREPLWTGRFTTTEDEWVFRHWIHGRVGDMVATAVDHAADSCSTAAIPGTAITANPSLQPSATVPVEYYFDLHRECRDCRRPFLFFAIEQKYWFESLGLNLAADAVRCPECRGARRAAVQLAERYSELLELSDRTWEQTLELADAGMTLVESGHFGLRVAERLRFDLRQRRAQAAEREPVNDIDERITRALRSHQP